MQILYSDELKKKEINFRQYYIIPESTVKFVGNSNTAIYCANFLIYVSDLFLFWLSDNLISALLDVLFTFLLSFKFNVCMLTRKITFRG